MADPDKLDETWDQFIEAITPTSEVYTNFMQEQILKLVDKALGNAAD